MPVLSANSTDTFGLSLGNAGGVSWVCSYINHQSSDKVGGAIDHYFCASGTATALGTGTIFAAFSPKTRPPQTSSELQFFCIVNGLSGTQVVTMGKLVEAVVPAGILYLPFCSNTTLGTGESLIYGKEYGFQVFDSTGLAKLALVPNPLALSGVSAVSYQAGGQSVPNNTPTAVIFDSLLFAAPTSLWAIGQPTRLTAPQAGVFRVVANVIFPTAGVNTGASLWFQVNGTATPYGKVQQHISNIASQNTNLLTEFLFTLNAGDYVEAYVSQNNGSPLALVDDAGPATNFNMALVR